ncbi:MAG: sulfite exporter TauE/SafE family protein, partial [Phycisphaerales bacterium]|nr:sulfite exporter TauE/SafE family protein [Phycisphaerales bacterium]
GVPAPLGRLFQRGHAFAMRRRPATRALTIGLLTTLLPCGWLYAFAITAAGTGSAPLGALTMAVFWLGTVPVLVGLGVGVQRLAGPLRRHVPTVTAAALVLVGVVALAGRFNVPALAATTLEPTDADAIARVQALDAGAMPCCNPE